MNEVTKQKMDVLTVTLNAAIDKTLIIGEFKVGAVNRVESESSVAGGKGVNVAAALADFGFRVAATGFLGQDNDAPFRHLFADKTIDDRMIRLAGQTRTGIKILDPVGGETTDINFAGLAPAPDDLRVLDRELEIADATWIVLAGSVPPGLNAQVYRDLTTKLRARGHKIALDTSGDALRLALLGAPETMPHLVKPNIHELEEFVGRDLPTRDDVLEAARALLQRGVEIVAVSMGADGAILVTHDEAVFAQAPAVTVKSTVGAGDALVAGLVAARLQNRSLEECARLATAFALDTLTRVGAGLSDNEIIENLARSVEVKALETAKKSADLAERNAESIAL